jgi:hypothetical protein
VLLEAGPFHARAGRDCALRAYAGLTRITYGRMAHGKRPVRPVLARFARARKVADRVAFWHGVRVRSAE